MFYTTQPADVALHGAAIRQIGKNDLSKIIGKQRLVALSLQRVSAQQAVTTHELPKAAWLGNGRTIVGQWYVVGSVRDFGPARSQNNVDFRGAEGSETDQIEVDFGKNLELGSENVHVPAGTLGKPVDRDP